MNLNEQISLDFKEAYKAKDMKRKNFLGLILGAIKNQETRNIESSDENVLKVLKSIEKGLNESIESGKKMNLDVSDYEQELDYMQPYLPKMMNEYEITSLVMELIKNNPDMKQNMLIGLFNKENKGKAFDNNLVRTIIGKLVVY